MKFGQLIEYNMRNIFLEKSWTKCGGKTFQGPFLKKWRIDDDDELFSWYVGRQKAFSLIFSRNHCQKSS